MAKGNDSAASTPKGSVKKTPSQSTLKGQKSILGFFSKTTPKPANLATRLAATPVDRNTPVPSSDPVALSSPLTTGRNKENGRASRPAAVKRAGEDADDMPSSPVKKGRKAVKYAESEDEANIDEVFKPVDANRRRVNPSKRRKTAIEDSDDEFGLDADTEAAMLAAEEDMDNFVVPDDSDDDVAASNKRKRSAPKARKAIPSSPPRPSTDNEDVEMDGPTATASQWAYDPENPGPRNPYRKPVEAKKSDKKQKAHMSEPDQRYPWLANIKDADRNPIGHPDYDPRTIFIPPGAWNKFSPFEKQYWEIKCKLWDTIVFFKKGKFYELYENDATIGHQLFDLKLTDRVNMRMVGVPEASLDLWANQFLAKGFKIARVDQMESALAKEMRERDDSGPKSKKEEKIIKRELASVLTLGTLVDPGMLQDDMATYCVAIKESEEDGRPVFGIAFVDTATAQFQLSEFVDDVDITKFETFVAQIRPAELLLEKGCISTKALRILKNNTGPTTLWNYLKPGKEFLEADVACRDIDGSDYFKSDDGANAWPKALEEAREKEVVMSAFGALLQYLRLVKRDQELISLGNFTWYDPIRKATSLVLDGQTLINLEIFANTFDGGAEGTLFQMINRCVTPFGKRMLRQWVCHPLADAAKINARLDAVEAIMADSALTSNFTSSLSKIPDLERLLSRIHAGSIKAQDFVRVVEGFEQIEYTMSLLDELPAGEGVIGQLLSSMPDLAGKLDFWKDAFDRTKAREEGILVPQRGVEEDYDESQDKVNGILSELDAYLKEVRKKLSSSSIVYRDNGKEIYQLEVPVKIKTVPKGWDQMSATKQVKRFYSPELRNLVRRLQEAQETHGQISRKVAGRVYARFDEDYTIWLAAVRIIAQLDCLISLAKASSSLGSPSCRPEFVNSARTVVEFEDLRHPCMIAKVDDFIPNDIKLGGSAPLIDLLTGANAAGKSTVLRMTCIAAILAQVGCHLPCASARLTPIDRIMSRLGAFDNIFAAQSTFFVELSETKKILAEATPRSLVILDELGRGTSSYDGVAVAQAVLHDVATRIGCVGFFATHYHSLAAEFAGHPEIRPARMAIEVDEAERRVTFLYKLERGVAEGSFGMHCAAMCGIPRKVIERAEVAAREWEHTSRLKDSLEKARSACYIPLGMQSDVAWVMKSGKGEEGAVGERTLEVLRKAIAGL
ncbi:putative DNA mismatch repair protein Msh6 [Trichodelitschia bisporula]|uniref:DNA mismatch repair protein n=1 Tax=Trichodelitschia bisporula TaxID=703511 RepID=A0A6G1I362_9PEZI|nr:putative DNA mismatch repair protein Msh6 [Trichodelitschia bisporula]